jgi:hypothetical protein
VMLVREGAAVAYRPPRGRHAAPNSLCLRHFREFGKLAGATGRWRPGFTVSVFGSRGACGPYRNRSHSAYHTGSIRAIGLPRLAEPSGPR